MSTAHGGAVRAQLESPESPARPRAWSGRSWAVWTTVLLTACGGGHAPAPPAPDASAGRDGSPVDVGATDADTRHGRPTDPRLPPADLDLTLPYLGEEQTVDVELVARPGKLDVHLSVDTTGSFGGEIDALQSDITDTILPAIEGRVADVTFGVSRFEDFPADPFGAESDHAYRLLTALTTSSSRVASAVASLDSPLGSGGDLPEAGYEALYQIATGEGYTAAHVAWIPPFPGPAPGGGELGGVGFRDGAMKVVVQVTDAPSHSPGDYADVFPGTHGRVDVLRAFEALDARLVGIASDPGARPQLEDLALATGAVTAPSGGVCPTGVAGGAHDPVGGRCPLVFDARSDGTGVSEAVVDGIVGLVDAIQYDEVYGQAPEDRLGFIRSIAAVDAVTDGSTPPGVEDRHPAGDGVLDTFTAVHVGTRVRFTLHFQNLTVEAEDYEQIFRFAFELVGDGEVLERQIVRVRVPLTRPSVDAGLEAGPDAGVGDAGSDAMEAGVGDAGGATSLDAGDAGPDAGDAGP